MSLHPEIQKLMGEMWHEIELSNQKRLIEAAKLDPEKHKLSRYVADNKPASYFYVTVTERRSRRSRLAVRWCWMTHPNIAGYFLSWRQRETSRSVKRTQWKAHKHRYLGEQRAQREKAKAGAKS
jgi:hypothetical protein